MHIMNSWSEVRNMWTSRMSSCRRRLTFVFYYLLELWSLTYLHSEILKKKHSVILVIFTWLTPSSSFSPQITGVSFQRAVLGAPVTPLRAEVGVGPELLSACVAPSESLCRTQQNSFKLTAFTWPLISTSSDIRTNIQRFVFEGFLSFCYKWMFV